MRLNANQVSIIKQSVAELAGPLAVVRLFGSRTNDAKRGGDIDLLVELPADVGNSIMLEAQIGARVSVRLEGQKVDVILKAANSTTLPIHRVAMAEGILL